MSDGKKTRIHNSAQRTDGVYNRGIDGQKHVTEADRQGRDGHFTDEGQYRRAIDQAVAENSRQ